MATLKNTERKESLNKEDIRQLIELIQKNYGINTDPIVQASGTDITHWFDNTTKDVIHYFHVA